MVDEWFRKGIPVLFHFGSSFSECSTCSFVGLNPSPPCSSLLFGRLYFQVIRCLLIVPFPESSLNDEAGRLFMESYTEYERRCKVWVSVHASKSLSGEATCGGTLKAGAKVKSGTSVKAAAGATASKTTGGETKKVAAGGSGKVVGKAAGQKGDASVGGGSAVGGAAGGAKRREEPAVRKTVKDRQKEAKKKGLKRL